MSLYNNLSEKFTACCDPTLGAVIRPNVVARPVGFEMGIFCRDRNLLLITVSQNDNITWQFNPTEDDYKQLRSAFHYFTRILQDSYWWVFVDLSSRVKHDGSPIRTGKQKVRAYKGTMLNSAGEVFRETVMPDPERIVNETKRLELNQKIHDASLNIAAYIAVVADANSFYIVGNKSKGLIQAFDELLQLNVSDEALNTLWKNRYGVSSGNAYHYAKTAFNKYKNTYMKHKGLITYKEVYS